MCSLQNIFVVFVFFIFMIQSSTSSSLEINDKLAQLIERLDRMQTKIDAMRSREEELEAENAKLTEQLDKIRVRVEALEIENDKWTRKFDDLEAENEKFKTKKLQQDEELQQLKSQISHTKFSLSAAKLDGGQPLRILSRPPTSCQELKNQNGLWPMDGIHLLKKDNTIQAAFCLFAADGSPVSEVLMGQVNVKTKIVHFYVQRNSTFGTNEAVIPFQLARLNAGNAFDLTSGIFTAPVPGIYHFDASAVKHLTYTSYLFIYLQVNGINVGLAYTGQSATGSYDVVSLSASLRLAAGDKVNLLHLQGGLFDDDKHRTHFTGWLVEEEIM